MRYAWKVTAWPITLFIDTNGYRCRLLYPQVKKVKWNLQACTINAKQLYREHVNFKVLLSGKLRAFSETCTSPTVSVSVQTFTRSIVPSLTFYMFMQQQWLHKFVTFSCWMSGIFKFYPLYVGAYPQTLPNPWLLKVTQFGFRLEKAFERLNYKELAPIILLQVGTKMSASAECL